MSIFISILSAIRHLLGSQPATREEVEAALAKRESQGSERLNWRESIVDLQKLLGQPSDLKSRERLAEELGYSGKLDGSAEMNIWLHERVMQRVCDGTTNIPRYNPGGGHS